MGAVHIIGGGLAGSEAAFQAAEAGAEVVLHEMRPSRPTFAHQTDSLAELVCSNSFRSDDWQNNAVGLLHEEMRRAGSLIMRAADTHKLPAGGALAVDRHGFSAAVTAALQPIRASPLSAEVTSLPTADQGLSSLRPALLLPMRLPARSWATGEEAWPFSMPSHPSCIAILLISVSPGFNRAMTRKVLGAGLPTISTCRWTRPNTKILSQA